MKAFLMILLTVFLVVFVFAHVDAQQPKSTLTANNTDPINREEVDRYLKTANAPDMVGAHPKTYSICVLLYADMKAKPIERGYACRVQTEKGFELQFSDDPINVWDVNVPQTKGSLFVMKWVSKDCRIALWPNSHEVVFGVGNARCDP